jgi:hypothetical protein
MRLPFAKRSPRFKPPAWHAYSAVWYWRDFAHSQHLELAAALAAQPTRSLVVNAVRGRSTGTFP